MQNIIHYATVQDYRKWITYGKQQGFFKRARADNIIFSKEKKHLIKGL